MQQHRHDAQPLDERPQHAIQIVRAGVVLGQPPGRLLLDVAVQPAHALPDLVERDRQLDAVDQLRDALAQAREVLGERRVGLARSGTTPSR